MDAIWQWAKAHPWGTLTLAIVVVATVANRIIEHYGDDHPRLKKALRFILSLLSAVKAKGATESVGLGIGLFGSKCLAVQVPGLSWCRPKKAEAEKK